MGEEPRPRRGGAGRESARLPCHGLRQVPLRPGAEAEAGAQAPEHDHDQGDQAPPEDRSPRLRHEEGPCRTLLAPARQGQGHDHVPRARDEPPRARQSAARTARRRCVRARRDRVRADPGRPQHGDAAGARQGAVADQAGRERGARTVRIGSEPQRPGAGRPEAKAAAIQSRRSPSRQPPPPNQNRNRRAPDAQDEDPLRRQEALQADRQRQADAPSRHALAHPGEEDAEAEARLPQAQPVAPSDEKLVKGLLRLR